MLKWLSLALLLIVAALQYHLWIGEGGLLEHGRVEARADQLAAGNEVLAERNDRLAAEVVDLKSGLDAIEERARNDLGMVRNEEQFYWVPSQRASNNPPQVAPPGADQGGESVIDQIAAEGGSGEAP
ncbi:cell division protein FtsB [Kushneria aurantia]|uniref:Cell division protein FtsB n=1 Tax=Kushneria aurantia TaxID=504092 RepID=A0ABV6FZN3_9GAMM|nr:cell division protein FtsB [Kushneria aurantia]